MLRFSAVAAKRKEDPIIKIKITFEGELRLKKHC